MLFRFTGTYVWTGASDGIAEGTPRWTSTQPLNWTNWASDQPDGQYSENCIAVTDISAPPEWEWHDQDCSLARNYICQYPAEGDCI